MSKTKLSALKSARTKSPTRLPGFILKSMGKRDAKKGSSVPDAFVATLCQRALSFETADCIRCEKLLSKVRRRAATMLTELEDARSTLSSLPPSKPGNTVSEIRTNRGYARLRYSAAGKEATALSALADISELITSAHTIIIERKNRLTHKGKTKINSYISGVRTVIPDYSPAYSEHFGSAVDDYLKRHADLDGAVRAKTKIYKED